jgi:uncharacterized protein
MAKLDPEGRGGDLPADRSAGEDLIGFELIEEIGALYEGKDPAHDFTHALRVWRTATAIAEAEGADPTIVALASLLHDAASGPKNRGRDEAEERVLERIEELLKRWGYPDEVIEGVLYAVEVHSYSKGIEAATLEARVLQDADRLDAIGAIGIARVFMTGGALGRPLYNPDDPFCRGREPDDGMWNLDHFFSKLLKLEEGMHTPTGKRLATRRGEVLRRYLTDLEEEISKGI